MRVLGIDPGSSTTGYGIVEKNGSGIVHVDCGCCRVKKILDFYLRLREIHAALEAVIEKYSPEAVVIERIFLAKNASSALKLGESRGVALLAAAQAGLPVYEYSTREVKQAVTGYGQATKDQIQKMVRQLLHLPEVASEDASDALAVAICHLQSCRLREITERAL